MTENSVRAGSATTDITPAQSVPMGGYGPNPEARTSTGVHDDLRATSLVLSDGGTTVAIIAVDLLNVSWSLSRRMRARLIEEGPIDELILAAIHTHAGPHVPAPAIDVNPLLAVDSDVSPVIDRILDGVESVVRTAYAGREPASVRVGRAENETTPINRRAVGGVNGGVRVPAGTIDPECVVVDVETASGEETLLYNFACHPVCTTPDETLLSADWPGYARDRITSEVGATTLFCNGATGDVNPRDRYAEERSGEAVYEYMEAIGFEVAETVLAAREAARSSEPIAAPVIAESRTLSLPVKSAPDAARIRSHITDLDEEIDRLEAADHQQMASTLAADRTYARELLAIAEWDATRLPARLTYVETGPLGMLGLPGEIFAQYGLMLKRRARTETLLPISYADGYVGYVPPLRELENGGYEVQTAKIAPEAIDRFRSAAIDLVTAGRQ